MADLQPTSRSSRGWNVAADKAAIALVVDMLDSVEVKDMECVGNGEGRESTWRSRPSDAYDIEPRLGLEGVGSRELTEPNDRSNRREGRVRSRHLRGHVSMRE